MCSSGDFNVLNFQSLIEKYEAIIQDVTNELNTVQINFQVEQSSIRDILQENSVLNTQLHKVLAEKQSCDIEHTYKESDLIENLKLQLKSALDEKEEAINLWQNATETIDYLEGELKTYQDNTEGLVPKSKLHQLKETYETKLNELQNTVSITKNKLEDIINIKSQKIKIKDKEIIGTLQSQDNNFKIIKNLEEEVLKLQKRLSQITEDKNQLEINVKNKSSEIEILKNKVQDCRLKVEEALQVVEAAFNEKDAALMRENETKEEIARLSKSLEEIIEETEMKIKSIQNEHDKKLEKALKELKESQNKVKNYTKQCEFLENELERFHKGQVSKGDTSKLLTLEKNLENTFQKLLLSEKQNIKLKSEAENIKEDLDQMAQYYERDIKARETEKSLLKEEIKKLKISLEESNFKASKNSEIINKLNEKITMLEIGFKQQLEDTTRETSIKIEDLEELHRKTIEELEGQLFLQTEVNRKWRNEAKNMTERLEKRILELKMTLNKIKQENKLLNEKLKESNLKTYEYKKFLEMISQDVNKITSIAIPDGT